jgi:hypothetical protein
MLNKIVIGIICIILLLGFSGIAKAQLITNGGFETGDLTGWTSDIEAGSAGNFYVMSGTTTPRTTSTVLPPPQGTFAAVTDNDENGSYIIYQDITVPITGPTQFSAVVYIECERDYVSNTDLSYSPPPNQQVRIDIIDPASPIREIGAGVLLNVFETTPATPLSLGYTAVNADLTTFAGQTVRIRIAGVSANGGILNAAVDDVSVTTTALNRVANVSRVPTMTHWGMIIFMVIAGLISVYYLYARRKGIKA